jgi:Gly-Xaa carboxypeptidase
MLTGSCCQSSNLIVSSKTCEMKTQELISSTSSLDETLNHLITTLSPLAHQLNYTISFFESPSHHNSTKHITVSHKSAGFEPAPITSGDSESFKLLAGTGKAVFGKELVVAPTGMYGMCSHPFNEVG